MGEQDAYVYALLHGVSDDTLNKRLIFWNGYSAPGRRVGLKGGNEPRGRLVGGNRQQILLLSGVSCALFSYAPTTSIHPSHLLRRALPPPTYAQRSEHPHEWPPCPTIPRPHPSPPSPWTPRRPIPPLRTTSFSSETTSQASPTMSGLSMLL